MTKEMLLETKGPELEDSSFKEVLKEKYHNAMARYKAQLILLFVFLVVILIIVILTYIPPFNEPEKVYWVEGSRDNFRDPTFKHLLGTDQHGRDYLTRLLHAIRNSLVFGFITGLLCTGIAVFLGVIGPFKGGVTDTTTSFITNIALVFPQIPFILLMSAILQTREWWITMLIIGLFTWPWAARSIRSQVLTLKERNYVKVAKMSGLKESKIAFVEVLPNVLPYIFLAFIIFLGNTIIIEAGIAIIGLGQQNWLTLGLLLNHAVSWGLIYPRRLYAMWLTPGICLILIYLAFFIIHSSVSRTFEQRKV
ncbi:Metal-staphylopine import system permease protein CntC [subsurface metagenome]